jgi:hypothetical protein
MKRLPESEDRRAACSLGQSSGRAGCEHHYDVVQEIEHRERQRRRALAAMRVEAELARRETQRAICKQVEALERDRSKQHAHELEEEERSVNPSHSQISKPEGSTAREHLARC